MSYQELYLGADCGEAHHHLALHDSNGDQLRSLRVKNEEESLSKALRTLVPVDEATTIHLVVESLYGFSARLVEIGRDLGFTLWQVNPKAVKSFRDLEGQPHKSDEIDASLLARMVCLKMRGCRLATRPRPEELQLRRLGRLHKQLTEQLTQVRQRFRSALLEPCPEIVQKKWEGPQWSSQTLLAILKRWPGFEGLATARSSTIEAILRKLGTSPAKRQKRAAALKELARRLPSSREVWTLELSLLVAQLQMLREQRQQVDKRIFQGVQEHPIATKLTDMVGIGNFTAAVLVGELLPLVRTSPEPKVATYAGLTPLSRRSGKGGVDIFARGTNKHALKACYMSAIASLKHGALDRAYYDKQRRQHKGHPKEHVTATIALARQRHKLMYKLMKTEAKYDPDILLRSHLARIEPA